MKKSWNNLPARLCNFLFVVFFLSFNPLWSLAEKKYRADETPHPLKDITIKEHLGRFIDLKLVFKDEKNQSRPLNYYFGDQPVLMSIVYYNCPSLCNFHLNGLFEGLEELANYWNKPYQLLLVSMDHTEKPPLAEKKKNSYLQKFKKLQAGNIHFLTGSEDSIKVLADSLGFAFRWDKEIEQFAHHPVAYVLSPEAMISRYLYGVQFEPKTLQLSLLEAGVGKIGNIIDRILLFCYRFNPTENKYTLYAVNIMKVGGILIILALIFLLVPAWLKERRQNI